jgi:hypothetical protein
VWGHTYGVGTKGRRETMGRGGWKTEYGRRPSNRAIRGAARQRGGVARKSLLAAAPFVGGLVLKKVRSRRGR